MLSVTLDTEGRVRDLVVTRSSGLDFLDAEAMQAFEKAQPFSNPPRALAQNGIIRWQGVRRELPI